MYYASCWNFNDSKFSFFFVVIMRVDVYGNMDSNDSDREHVELELFIYLVCFERYLLKYRNNTHKINVHWWEKWEEKLFKTLV